MDIYVSSGSHISSSRVRFFLSTLDMNAFLFIPGPIRTRTVPSSSCSRRPTGFEFYKVGLPLQCSAVDGISQECPALLLVDHGSKVRTANDHLRLVAELVQCRAKEQCQTSQDAKPPFSIIEIAHMELAEPSIEDGIEACLARGATSIVVLPYFLAPGRHAMTDIPRMVDEILAKRSRTIPYRISPILGLHEYLADLVLLRAQES